MRKGAAPAEHHREQEKVQERRRERRRVELHQVQLRSKDRVLLCTDGLYGEVTDEEIGQRLLHVEEGLLVEPCLKSLISLANKKGGRDNITGVLGLF